MQPPLIFLIFYITLLSTVLHHLKCQARDSIISGGNPLIDGNNETLVSKEKRFELGFFTPNGNGKGSRYIGIWYYDRDPRTVVWVACRDKPLTGVYGVFGIADDGNVKLWNGDKLFENVTNVEDSRDLNRTLKLLDTGNLILFDGESAGESLWQSFYNPTDTFLPGMNISVNKLISWISSSDPASGNYTFLQEKDGYSIQKGSTGYWRSRDGGSLKIYNDVPNYVDQIMLGTYLIIFPPNGSFVGRRKYIPYKFSSKLPVYNNFTRVLMSTSGLIQYFEGDDDGGFTLRWSEPNDTCKVYEPCGKSANCDSRNQPMCLCLPGFKPQSKKDWDLGRYSEGCVKEESMSCQDDADKMKQFLNLPVKKVDSASAQRFDITGKDTTCERECLSDCECMAYLLDNNSTSRETGDNHQYCWKWTQDLTNLQIGLNDDNNRISIRAPESKQNCQPCFLNQIPYPLSSGPHCGDPLYRSFSCNNATGVISFHTLSGEYPVIGIHEATDNFVIQFNSDGDVRCKTGNISIQNLKLDQSSPFFVTNSCYVEPGHANPDVKLGSKIEISWRTPKEPTCNYWRDCKDWPNSYCHDKGDGQKRCYCNPGYEWNGSIVSCTNALTNSERQEEGSGNKKHMEYVIFPIVTVAVVVLILCCINIVRRTRCTTLFDGEGNIEEPVISHEYEGPVDDIMNIEKDGTKAIGVPFYSLDIVLSATDKFSDANKLGQGGFGPVYKGKFPGGQEIAVKRLSSCSRQGIKEFQNEVVLISKLQHRNLVRLLGYSISKQEKILLYEYMPNRSLDGFIFDQENRLLLDWKKRFDIIIGIARGLLYLHQDSRLRVIHRDLKTSNILLDENMNPKISDFGLARIVEGKGAEASTKNVIGTLGGYMSPEYALEGKFSTKSDVFSFGVTLLEIVSGKKNNRYYNPEQVLNLLRYAWMLWTENKVLDLTDPTLVESCHESQVIRCINIGLLCVQEDPSDRPTMANVVLMLDSETCPLPCPTQPAFVVRRHISAASSSSSSKPDRISNNELTISMYQGR